MVVMWEIRHKEVIAVSLEGASGKSIKDEAGGFGEQWHDTCLTASFQQ